MSALRSSKHSSRDGEKPAAGRSPGGSAFSDERQAPRARTLGLAYQAVFVDSHEVSASQDPEHAPLRHDRQPPDPLARHEIASFSQRGLGLDGDGGASDELAEPYLGSKPRPKRPGE